jgi:2-amino-4-hydroxy-6-hydroxymethyldihydropteridine diphosphokinase
VRQATKSGDFLPQIRSIALIAVGSNTGFGELDATECVLAAVENLPERLGVIRGMSRLYRTPAFPPGSGPAFCNAAAVIETDLPAQQVLAGLHAIEADFGRERSLRWGPRSLDLDLIAMGAQVLPDRRTQAEWVRMPPAQQAERVPDTLLLPHPRLQDRGFVLVPLAEALAVAEIDWVHPVTGATVAQMLATLPPERIAEVEVLQ